MAEPDARDFRFRKMPLDGNAGLMPALGFGTLIPDPVATYEAARMALEAGFRALDTAERYRTEREVGNAVHEALTAGGLKREDLFIITKLWNNNHRPERVLKAFEASRQRLRLDYIDLYLIHTPFAFQPGDDQEPRDSSGAIVYDREIRLLDTWRAMEDLVDRGKCKAIGLSDVNQQALQGIYGAARIKPAVLHVESHPYLPQWDLLDYCAQHGIVFQAFAPLGHGGTRLLNDPVVTSIARNLGKTPAQVLLAWAIERGTAVLTTSKTPSRIREDFDITPIPDVGMQRIRKEITTRLRLNTVVENGVPGFIPNDK